MSRLFLLAAIVSALMLPLPAQDVSMARWQALLKSGKCEEARQLCTDWTKSADTLTQTEGHKCMASVVMCNAAGIELQANDAGGGTIGPAYPAALVDESVAHLNAALKLSPQDLSIHQGRLYTLEVAGRFDEMADALNESCQTYKGQDARDAWLAYSYELSEDKQFKAALKITKVLEKYYPESHDVIGNIGALYSMSGDAHSALPYLEKAVALAPDDAYDNWNLARNYDFLGKVEQADAQYQRAMKLNFEPEQKRSNACMYAEFVEKSLHDHKRACELEKQSCDQDHKGACAAKPTD